MRKEYSAAEFAENLVKLRAMTGKKQKDVADELDMSASALSAYEKGIREPPLKAVVKFAQYYGVSIDSLFGLEEKSNQSMNTQADYLRHIVALADSGVPIAFCVTKSTGYNFISTTLDEFEIENYDGTIDGMCPELLLYSAWAQRFLNGYQRILSLAADQLVDREQYHVLVENLLQRFNAPLFEPDDGDEEYLDGTPRKSETYIQVEDELPF